MIQENNSRSALRKNLLEKRQTYSPETVKSLSQQIQENIEKAFPELTQMIVGFYSPIKNEPDLFPLIRSWIKNPDFKALLPLVQGKGQPLLFRKWTPDTKMGKDSFGISIPEEGEFLLPEALLIPVVGIDQAGYRLGYGGGFYDITLASLPYRPLCIGIGYEICKIPDLQPQAHDIALEAFVTESGIYRV